MDSRTVVKNLRWKPKVSDCVLLLICLLYLVQYSDRVNIATAADAIRRDLQLSNTQLGFAFSAFAYPYAIVQLFGGWLGDKFGPRRILTAFGLIVACASLLTGFVGGIVSLVMCRILLGIGEAPTLATATSAMARWLPAERRGLGQGITHACARLGSALTPPIVVLLMTFWNWRGTFIIAGVIGVLWIMAWYWYFRDDPATHPGMNPEELARLPKLALHKQSVKVPVRRLLRRMLPVTLVDFCYAWTLWVFLTWLPSFFMHNYHLNLRDSALFTSGVFIAGIGGDMVGGVLSDHVFKRTGNVQMARRNVIILGMGGALIFLLPVLFLTDLKVVSICLCMAFFLMELVIAPLWAVPMDITPRYAGTASGFMNIGFGVAGITSPLLFGFIIDETGNWHLPFVLSIGLLLIGMVAAFWMRPDKPFIDHDDSAPGTEIMASIVGAKA
ncbi:MFS transporter [Glaciimonas sp. Gout2]|uniref:MFS transporter n=1 Tax=unclassified Glaciimonas TaxID=2644401 RepID=UPI002B23870E|nr:MULTISPECIES: MFS transporter [unclassified Glaciimonas]MEB0011521.1 MFS transporter [Glaciimonas sp. Cout2]MEB0081318.1 MFS transporter [Glaciimonas sp. Gout2]